MAIEFNCPYCTSTIRVPDDASGKKGTCPRCETPIMVPVIDAQPPAAAHTSAPAAMPPPEPPAAAIDSFDPLGEPVFPGPPQQGEGAFPLFDPAASAAAAPVPSYARALKRRRKRGMGMLIPLLFGLALVVPIIYLFLQTRPTLNGELTAEALPEFENVKGGVGRGEVADLPKDAVQYVLEELQANPARLTSGLMETEFRGTKTGIEVRVFEGKKTTFFRVAPRKIKDFDDWVRQHSEELDQPRAKELNAAAKRFFKEYADTEGNVPDLPGYRDPLGLNATVGGVGYNLVGVVGGQAYSCVYEDDQQRLYFLLPRGTKEFEIEGKKLESGESLFPGHYNVKVE